MYLYPPLATHVRACAAADRSIHWDHKHHDLWLECFTQNTSPSTPGLVPRSNDKPPRRPCTYCGGLYHFPTTAPSIPFEALSILPPLPLLYPDIALVEDTSTPQALPPPPPPPAPPTSPAPLGPYAGTSTIPRADATITEGRKTELQQAIRQLEGRRTCTKRELLSLIGKLTFACKVVPPGRLFLRRLIDLSTTVRHLHHRATLNKAARADLAWWRHFLPTWPGTSLFLQSDWTPAPDMELFTDASNLGYGVYWAGQWFNHHWSSDQSGYTIAWKELYAILVAASTWGNIWLRKRVLQQS